MDEENYILLDEIDDEEFTLTLLDGSVWDLNPSDISVACAWSPTARISIKENVNNETFSSSLTNLESGQIIKARRSA